jgi:hypothetical protein
LAALADLQTVSIALVGLLVGITAALSPPDQAISSGVEWFVPLIHIKIQAKYNISHSVCAKGPDLARKTLKTPF